MSYKTIQNAATGNKFIVFAQGAGLVFGVRAWVETEGANAKVEDAKSTLALRFRAEREEGEQGGHVAKAVENMIPNVKWGNGSPDYRSAVAHFTIPGLINGTALKAFLEEQGALNTLYKAWSMAFADSGVVMSMTATEFSNAITTTMEGEPPTNTNVSAKVPFSQNFMEQVLNDETTPISKGTMKAIGLN